MPGPAPKPAALRQRRNKTATAGRFETEEQPLESAPKLGEHPDGEDWNQRTIEFWESLWRSPMAPEFLEADLSGLYVLALLVDRFWVSPSTSLAAEIRMQRQCYGLTPIDRRRLQWEIVRVERSEQGAAGPATAAKAGRAFDPRAALVLV